MIRFSAAANHSSEKERMRDPRGAEMRSIHMKEKQNMNLAVSPMVFILVFSF